MDADAAHPIVTYRKVIMTLNGVTKNVVVPVPSRASGPSQKDHSQNDIVNESDDECIITDIAASGPVSPSASCDDVECIITDITDAASGPVLPLKSCRLLPERSDADLVDLVVEPVEISPLDDQPPIEISPSNDQPLFDTVDLTLSPEKAVASCGISHSAQNSVTTVCANDSVCPSSRGPTCVVVPITLQSTASASTANVAESVVSVEAQPTAFPSATIFRGVSESRVGSVLPSETVAPVVIAPQPDTDVPSVSVVSSPRTMTKEEAVASGWFADDDRAGRLQPRNTAATSQPSEASYDASLLLETLSEMSSFSAESLVESDFVSSAELVSLEDMDVDMTDSPTDLALGIENRSKIVPILSDGGTLSSSFLSSGSPVRQQHKLEIDVAVDRTSEPLAKETKLCHEFENVSDYFNDEDDCKYGTLMGEEDEPLTAVVEGMVNDDPACEASDNTETTEKPVKRGRGRPPKKKLPRNSHETAIKKPNMAKRTGGRPLTAAERHRLKDCRVWLQKLQLPSAAVRVQVVWRYLCCHESVPPASAACSLCCRKQNSDSFFELEVARKFRAGSQLCKRAVKDKDWSEFSVDSRLLPKPSTTDSSRSEKSPVNKSSSMVAQTSNSDCDATSQGNKKYLLIRTETGTFVVPVDSAVGCIVSEREIATMLTSQSVLPSSSCTGEFSKDALLAACSQLKPSHSPDSASTREKPSSPQAPKTSASPARRNTNGTWRKRDDSHHSSLPPPQSKTHVKKVGAANRISRRKRPSNRLVDNARHSFCRFAMKRELCSLGLRDRSPRKKKS